MSSLSASTSDMKPCPYCGEQIMAVAKKCRYCQEYLDDELRRRAAEESTPNAVDRMLLPVGRPLSAIAAGYMGLMSLVPPFGIFAIIFGVVALRKLKREPHLSGRGRAWFGLIMGIPFTLIYGFAFLALALQ